jgi:hypothetical protein
MRFDMKQEQDTITETSRKLTSLKTLKERRMLRLLNIKLLLAGGRGLMYLQDKHLLVNISTGYGLID